MVAVALKNKNNCYYTEQTWVIMQQIVDQCQMLMCFFSRYFYLITDLFLLISYFYHRLLSRNSKLSVCTIWTCTFSIIIWRVIKTKTYRKQKYNLNIDTGNGFKVAIRFTATHNVSGTGGGKSLVCMLWLRFMLVANGLHPFVYIIILLH